MHAPNIQPDVISLLTNHALFSLLDRQTLETLAQDVELASFALGEVIIREGEAGDAAYLILSGRVRVFQQGADGKPVTLATLTRGELLGEHAMLKEQPRTASARAADDCVLLRIRRAVFSRLLDEHADLRPYLENLVEHRALARFLQATALLGSLPARQIGALLDQLEDRRCGAGSYIITEGEMGEGMFVLKSGEAKVARMQDGQETVLAYLGSGDFFGERALLLDEPRFASVIALADSELAVLSRAGFNKLLETAPQLKEQFTKKLQQYLASAELASKFGVKPSPPLQPWAEAGEGVSEIVWESPPPNQQPSVQRKQFGKRRPFVPQQDESDCGAACLAMLARYHGVPISVARLRYLAHVGSEGASMLSLTQTAEQIGFDWRAVTTDFDHLGNMQLPAIAHWKGYHYVVLYEAGNEGVLIGDPALGVVRYDRNAFAKDWTGKLLLLTATERLRRTAPARNGWQLLASLLSAHATRLTLIAMMSFLLAGMLVLAAAVATRLELLAATSALIVLVYGIRRALLVTTARRLSSELEARSLEHVLQLPLRWFDSQRTGAVGAVLNHEYSGVLLDALTRCADLLLVPAGICLLAAQQLFLGGFAAIVVLAAALFALIAFAAMLPLRREAQRLHAMVQSERLEAVQNIATIKTSTSAEKTGRKIQDLLQQYETVNQPIDTFRMIVLWFAAFMIAALGFTALALASSAELIGAFIGWTLVSAPLWRVLAGLGQLAHLAAALQRAADVADLPREQAAPQLSTPAALRGRVRFSDVCFSHHPESAAVLSNITFDLAPGRLHWLLGRAGAGKTTLAHLLVRFQQPTAGTIAIDGLDVSHCDVSWLRRHIAFMAEDDAFVQGTFRENIALSEPQADLERVSAAARLADVHLLIMRFPLGYDTMLGPSGVRLSSSEMHKLKLARAFFHDARLLILDEPLAPLDAESARVLLKVLRLLALDRTILILTRQAPHSETDDQVIVLDEGRVVESGKPGELLQRAGLFASLTERRISL